MKSLELLSMQTQWRYHKRTETCYVIQVTKEIFICNQFWIKNLKNTKYDLIRSNEWVFHLFFETIRCNINEKFSPTLYFQTINKKSGGFYNAQQTGFFFILRHCTLKIKDLSLLDILNYESSIEFFFCSTCTYKA